MLSPPEALRLILESLPPFHKEDCALATAHGRVLRAELKADRDLPPFDRVTMDGYAVRSASLASGIARLRVDGTQAAGMRPFTLGSAPESCIEVMTGSVLPEGADCVIPYELTEREGQWLVCASGAACGKGLNVHRRGHDHRAGEVIVPAGVRLTGREIAVAAACGHPSLTVSHAPRIAIVSTGDELVEVDALVGPHQLRRSNDHSLRAALAQAGYARSERFHLRDNRQEIEHTLWHLLAEFDVLLITGGVSKGKFDFLPAELEHQGVRKVLQGVAQRPGKPFWFGMSARGCPVFALPGNPVSAYTCLHRYVLPALNHASGQTPRPLLKAELDAPVAARAELSLLVPVCIFSGPGARLMARPVPVENSGDLAGLVGTDGFVELPPCSVPFAAGHVAPFWPWV